MNPDTCCETRLSFVCNPGAGGESWSDRVWVKLGIYIAAIGGPFQSPPPAV